MCRVLTYLGTPIMIDELLYLPDNSFIKQSYHPKYMSHMLNLAGFGLVAWDQLSHHPTLPFIYKTDKLPFYDENLRFLSKKISSYCLLSHVRGVPYSEKNIVSNQNVHPFIFPDTHIALAHNGDLHEFNSMKFDLLDYIKPQYKKYIQGTTDSEWIYAVFISQLPSNHEHVTIEEVIKGVHATLKIIQNVRYKNNIRVNSPVNLFISNGKFIAATRFVFDYGWLQKEREQEIAHLNYHSLWYTYGEGYGFYDNEYKMKSGEKRSSIIIASEPLTEDTTTWIEVPEYTLIVAQKERDEIQIISHDINL